MSRTSVMTIGFFLIFAGIQLNFVESFELTPPAARFWNENIVNPASELVSDTTGSPAGFRSPWQQASWSNPLPGARNLAAGLPANSQRTLAHPAWICWPVFFAGMVFFLHGLSMRE
jgi:hypothetical protein